MMYNDKVGYGPTVRDALTELFGPGADATATGPAPAGPVGGQPPAGQSLTGDRPPAAAPGNQQGRAPEVSSPPAAVPPTDGVPTQLSAAKAAALQQVNEALDSVRQAQQGGNFAEYGQALQRLDDAMNAYRSAR
jgi:uncharacterized membrane protein (UPF0182 family)